MPNFFVEFGKICQCYLKHSSSIKIWIYTANVLPNSEHFFKKLSSTRQKFGRINYALVWKALFVEKMMSSTFEFLYSNKFHFISNLFLLFSVSFQFILLFVHKQRSILATFFKAEWQIFPTRSCVGKQREKGSTRD